MNHIDQSILPFSREMPARFVIEPRNVIRYHVALIKKASARIPWSSFNAKVRTTHFRFSEPKDHFTRPELYRYSRYHQGVFSNRTYLFFFQTKNDDVQVDLLGLDDPPPHVFGGECFHAKQSSIIDEDIVACVVSDSS